jgi:hypothetical protein
MFLKTMEDTMGRASFDAFIARYFQLSAFHWVDDITFHTLLHQMLFGMPDLESQLQIDTWLYQPGVPSNDTAPTSSRMWDRVRVQSDAFRAGRNASQLDRSGWTALNEENIFLQLIQDIMTPRMAELDATFGFSSRNTPPFLWLIAAAKRLNAADKTMLNRYLARHARRRWRYGTSSSTSAGRAYGVALFNQIPRQLRFADTDANQRKCFAFSGL